VIKAWSDDAWQDFEYWLKQDKKTLKRILALLRDIDRNGNKGIGKPERLSGDLAPYWSRRIDDWSISGARHCIHITPKLKK
jgi:toxin YoeB